MPCCTLRETGCTGLNRRTQRLPPQSRARNQRDGPHPPHRIDWTDMTHRTRTHMPPTVVAAVGELVSDGGKAAACVASDCVCRPGDAETLQPEGTQAGCIHAGAVNQIHWRTAA